MTIFETYKGDLRYSRRYNVTLLPHLSIPYSGTSAYGFVGAYEDQTPIPESIRLTMGWQLHLMAPFQEAAEYVEDTVIYAGIPNSGYGHFLLDAMARLWYAKDHPEIPIIWDATALPALAAPIFDIVGIRNRHLFLDRPMRFREVIFPVPGVSIGDYLLKDHADFLGAFNGGDPIPGKKLYLSRRNMKRGLVVAEEVIEDLVRSHGFQVYYPEKHTVAEQLEEISKSSIVLGVEGSAFHSVVLLKTPIRTRFFALARHRRGGGVFEHIRLQKGIQYVTLNLLLENKPLSATSEVRIDIELLGRLLFETKGLDEVYPLGNYVVNTKAPQKDYLDAINKFKLYLTATEIADYEVLRSALKRGDSEIVKNISSKFQAVRVDCKTSEILNGKRVNMAEALNLTTRAGRLNAMGKIINASSYLEIGVYAGVTFNQVQIENKIAVDPKFAFNFCEQQSEKVRFFEMESDEFFAKHTGSTLRFDVIYLDGLHEFEQTLRDLLNSLSFVHDRSLILIDDTLPKHYAAAQKLKSDNLLIRKAFDVYDNSWMGDVYKIVPFIHDFLPMYSYLTFPQLGQTVLFRQPRDVSSNGGGRRFSSLEEISRLSYVDFLKLKDEGLYNIQPTNEGVIESLQAWLQG